MEKRSRISEIPEEQWPVQLVATNDLKQEFRVERRKLHNIFEIAVVEQVEVITCTKFSSWRKLIRVTAYVRRFFANLKASQKVQIEENLETMLQVKQGPLSSKELQTESNIG